MNSNLSILARLVAPASWWFVALVSYPSLAGDAPAKINPPTAGPPPKLVLPGENFTVEGRPAFVFLPPESKRANPQPWIFYAPTLPGYPDEAERWMHEQFLAAGIAVAGVDAGEAYGSPKSQALFNALYRELIGQRRFAAKPCLFGRSRGGLWVTSWAIANPARVAGIIGIYPVFDFRTYPGVTNAASAYGLTPAELEARAAELNPIERIGVLARARVPAALIHGDVDKVVPLRENSGEFVRRYKEAGAEALVKLIVLEGQGHNYFEGFFHSQELVDFAIDRARAGAQVAPNLACGFVAHSVEYRCGYTPSLAPRHRPNWAQPNTTDSMDSTPAAFDPRPRARALDCGDGSLRSHRLGFDYGCVSPQERKDFGS